MSGLVEQESYPHTSCCLPVACREVFFTACQRLQHDQPTRTRQGTRTDACLVQTLDITGDGTNFTIGHARGQDLHHF